MQRLPALLDPVERTRADECLERVSRYGDAAQEVGDAGVRTAAALPADFPRQPAGNATDGGEAHADALAPVRQAFRAERRSGNVGVHREKADVQAAAGHTERQP